MIETEFNELIEEYAAAKSELDYYKKLAEKLNQEIKDVMTENDMSEYINENYKTTKTISYRKSIDEDRLLDLMHSKGYEDVIKTREYVDSDALEYAIYHGKIDQDTVVAIGDCTESKEVVTLKVTPLKKGRK